MNHVNLVKKDSHAKARSREGRKEEGPHAETQRKGDLATKDTNDIASDSFRGFGVFRGRKSEEENCCVAWWLAVQKDITTRRRALKQSYAMLTISTANSI
ncbi:MAG: hypothetical protein COA78_26520 [Blastopirellula sp.]|nr:MAG: hypothetical protein COA78_26520 [Blastopirellula sp.]